MSTIKGLEATIAEAAEKQAKKEWDEFEQLAATWHTQHDADGRTLRKNPSSYYGAGRVPACRLDINTFDEIAEDLKSTLLAYSAAWQKARVQVLIKRKSEKILQQFALLEEDE